MITVKKLRVPLNLEGLNGNAFALLGAFQRAARREGHSKSAIDIVIREAQSGDYDNLLRVLMDNTIPE